MIKVSDRWIVDADTMCFILKEIKIHKKGKKAGETTEVIKGYFSSIPEALKRIYDTEVQEKVASTDMDLKSAIAEIHSIREMVKQDIAKAEIINEDK